MTSNIRNFKKSDYPAVLQLNELAARASFGEINPKEIENALAAHLDWKVDRLRIIEWSGGSHDQSVTTSN